MPSVFLHAPQDFRNLCAIARTLEVFGHREVYVFDPYRLVRDRYGKARARQMRDVSAGSFENIRWARVEEPEPFLRGVAGRVVATVADTAATSVTAFSFRPSDLLLFGGESRGLPDALVTLAGASVTIPSSSRTQSLNLGVALGIIVFEAERQLTSSASVLGSR